MSLIEKDNETGDFIIIESTSEHGKSKTTVIVYKADLSQKRQDTNAWQATSEAERQWFKEHYEEKFARLQELKNSTMKP